MPTRAPLLRRPPVAVRWGVHILLLVAVLLPIVGCGATEALAGTVAATRADVLTC